MYTKLIAITLSVAFLAVAAPAQEVPKQITFGHKHDCDPVVSPDGKHLAFATDRAGNYDVFVVTFGMPGARQLTKNPNEDRFPSWSPSSRNIVFSSKRTGKGDVFEVAVQGGEGYVQLTDREDYDTYPSYIQGGNGIMFITSMKQGLRSSSSADSIVFLDKKGLAGSVRELTKGQEARISPDGKLVVFVSDRTKSKDIWIMSSKGGPRTQLTNDPRDDMNPAFSADGKKIVFASERNGNFDVWTMDLDGGNKRQMTFSTDDEKQPCWSLGGFIYFARSVSSGKSNIFRISAK